MSRHGLTGSDTVNRAATTLRGLTKYPAITPESVDDGAKCLTTVWTARSMMSIGLAVIVIGGSGCRAQDPILEDTGFSIIGPDGVQSYEIILDQSIVYGGTRDQLMIMSGVLRADRQDGQRWLVLWVPTSLSRHAKRLESVPQQVPGAQSMATCRQRGMDRATSTPCILRREVLVRLKTGMAAKDLLGLDSSATYRQATWDTRTMIVTPAGGDPFAGLAIVEQLRKSNGIESANVGVDEPVTEKMGPTGGRHE